MQPPPLKLENISRLLGDRWCLRNISLGIMPGGVVAAGRSQRVGKTILLRFKGHIEKQSPRTVSRTKPAGQGRSGHASPAVLKTGRCSAP